MYVCTIQWRIQDFSRGRAASQTGGAFHSTGAPKCQEGVTFFGRGTSYTLDSARIMLTGATAGYKRVPQGLLLVWNPLPSTAALEVCVERRCMGRGLVGIGSAKARLIYSVVRCPKGRHFAGGASPPPPGSAPLYIFIVAIITRRLYLEFKHC